MIWKIKHNVVWKEGRIAFITLALTDARPQYRAARFFRVGVFQVFLCASAYIMLYYGALYLGLRVQTTCKNAVIFATILLAALSALARNDA